MKSKKAFGSRSDYLTLIWEPASAQCDFGEADFYEHGKLVRRYYLVLSFPYSNMAFVQLFSGESAECVCQGLSDIFTYIKGIPRFIVFDNATGIGRRIGDVIKETELFSRFRMHHRFEARFCNPYSGHEKGHVENKVDFVRNNMFVPEPAYDDIVSFNTALFDECLAFGSRPHYKHPEQTWAQRFGSDCKALLPLPAKPFDVVRFSAYKTDKWGHVTIDGCHTYSAHPKMKLAEVTVAFRAHIIEIIDSSGEIIAVHPRRFGSKVTCDIDPVSELSQLARKPNAWANSHLRHDLDDVLVDAMDMMGGDERNRVIEMLAASTRSCGYDDAVAALRELGALARPFTQSELDMAARHIFAHGAGGACELGPDLGYYDEVLLGRSI